MKRNTLIAIAVAAAIAAPLASAEGDKKDRQHSAAPTSGRTMSGELFDRLDKNQDGFVTREEAREATELQGRFAELDQDNDGKISRAEMRALDGERSAAGSSKARK